MYEFACVKASCVAYRIFNRTFIAFGCNNFLPHQSCLPGATLDGTNLAYSKVYND